MNTATHQPTLTPADLSTLAAELIHEIAHLSDIREGEVMTMGPVPYRRLDCDRRALAYVRARPRKKMVRVDISGLWLMPRESPLAAAGSGATKTLVLRSHADKTEAIAFLLATVEATRIQQARARERDDQRRARERELRAQIRRTRKPRPAGSAPLPAGAPPINADASIAGG